MSPKRAAAVGDRLPYLLAKLKTPRVLERLEQTAATAREEGWPYEQFLEVLLEAEVFARDASGSRNRIRHAAFPAHKTLPMSIEKCMSVITESCRSTWGWDWLRA
jgi:DNA replication protein DnaC